jgi:hypothetical protein
VRAAGSAAVALLVGAFFAAGCGAGGAPARLALPARPAHLANGHSGPFSALANGHVYGVSGDRARPLGTVAPGPRGIVFARGSVWAASPHAIVRIALNGSRPPARLPSQQGLTGLAASGVAVWGLHPDGSTLRLDPKGAMRSGAIPSALPNSKPVAIAALPGAVFVADRQGRLIRLDRLGRHVRWIGVGKNPIDVAAGDGFAWVALAGGTVVQVRPKVGGWQTRESQTTGRPAAIAFGGGRAWVAETDGRLFAIDSKSGHRELVATVGAGVTDAAYANGRVWIARASGRRGELVEISP